MAQESSYQLKIMKGLEAIGGKAINGQYTKSGEADIQGGYLVNDILRYIAIEVKTEVNYKRVMSGIKEVNGLYEIVDDKKLKEHEPMQIFKLNKVRTRGGLALIAFNFEQVQEYVNNEIQN